MPVDSPFTPWVLGATLLGLLALLVIRARRRDRREYRRFKLYRSTLRRQAMYRKWLAESFAVFGGSALVILLVAWQFVPRMLEQVESWPAMVSLRGFFAEWGALVAVGGALLVVALVGSIFLARNEETVPTIGDIHALLPRNRPELRYGALLSINAGVVEELLFRLAVPVLIFGITGNALVAAAASVVLFGMLHAYQGVWGIVATTVLGGLLMALFLVTGSILWPIVAHVLFDLRSLVLIPMVVYRVHRVGT